MRIIAKGKYPMTDAYYHIYNGEIHQKSRCIWHENTLVDFFRSSLIMRGYQSQDSSNKVWTRGEKRVVICLVDDYTTCSGEKNPYVPAIWDSNTLVITDNKVTCPTHYRVETLPASFFGIYAYEPEYRSWQPDRRFNFAINRIDTRRVALMLEYRKWLPWQPDRETVDYVNFNCWSWHGDNSSVKGLQQNFENEYHDLDQSVKDVHEITKDTDMPEMPYRNHDLDLESSMHQAWINMVAETYSGEAVIALSEKTFRTLVTPAPWQVYSGRYTVAYLEQLGFDCMSDMVDHGYDHITELRTMAPGDKLVEWWWTGNQNYQRLQSTEFEQVQSRGAQAAHHNRSLLAKLRGQWAQDFSAWWLTVLDKI
jgi:hypothetical protein